MLYVIRHPLRTVEGRWPLFYEDARAVTYIALCVAAVLALIWGIVMGVFYVERRSCFEKAADLGVELVEWGAFSDCRVEVDGNLVPIDNYRVSR